MAKLGSKYDCPADSLCPYARQVMVGLFLLCLMTLAAGWFVIWNIIGVILAFQGYWSYDNFGPAHAANLGAMMIIIGVSVVVGVNYIQDKITLSQWKKEQIAKSKGYQDIKPDSFIYVWFKNIHSKICPNITFKD